MNGFKCNITESTSTAALAKPQVPRRCGSDLVNNKQFAFPANCTHGAKQPFYWFNQEQNNVCFISFVLLSEALILWGFRCSRAPTRHPSIPICITFWTVLRTISLKTLMILFQRPRQLHRCQSSKWLTTHVLNPNALGS